MTRDPVNRTRYRALRVGLVLLALCALGGGVVVAQLGPVRVVEWVPYALVAAVALALLPVTRRLRASGNRAGLERIAQAMLGLGTLLILQRLAFSLYDGLIEDPAQYLFRPSYAFLPFIYVSSITVMRQRAATRLCWAVWLATVALTVPALALHTGLSFEREGMTALTLWLLFANPLFILLIHALPPYEEQLDRSKAQVAEMKLRTELLDRLTESEQRFNLVVESLNVGVWDRWLGPPARRWWSPRFYELTGYSPEELEPSADHIKSLLHPEDREPVWRKGTEQLQSGGVMNVDFRLRTKQRGYRWFNSHAKAQFDAGGRMVRLAGAITDIHEQRIAQDALRMAQAELTHLAYRDTLTDLYNRRYFDEHFQREWERARRHAQPLSLLLLDLDHFKAYNDAYGHPAGDACLAQVAQLLTRCATRPADIIARLGGEEFGIVLPETDGASAEKVGQRIQSLLAGLSLPHAGAPDGKMTLSIGIAAIEHPEGPGSAELFEQADKALYEAKRRGRNGLLRYGAGGYAAQPQLFPEGDAV